MCFLCVFFDVGRRKYAATAFQGIQKDNDEDESTSGMLGLIIDFAYVILFFHRSGRGGVPSVLRRTQGPVKATGCTKQLASFGSLPQVHRSSQGPTKPSTSGPQTKNVGFSMVQGCSSQQIDSYGRGLVVT